MRFSEEQIQTIYKFVMSYNADEKFKKNIEELYNDEVEKLSILQIYALEEVLRFGTKNIFNEFLQLNGNSTLEEAIYLFESFMVLFNADEQFRQYKQEQFREAKDTLSEIEIFIFEIILKQEKQEHSTEEGTSSNILEYDDFNQIKYNTDQQIRDTIENLLFGKFIRNALELPEMIEIKNRQRERGIIANSDKQVIIEEIRKLLIVDPKLYNNAVDTNFVKIKYQILLGKKEEAFGELLEYNTNISADEIYGREKDTSEEDAYKFFQDIVNKIKNGEKTSPRK